MDFKIGRYVLDINEKDIILDNGACYQIITKKVGKLWEPYSPVISKSLFDRLNKCGAVYTNEMLKKKAEMQELERKRRELEKQRQMGAKNGK